MKITSPDEVLENALDHGNVIALDFETRGPKAADGLHPHTTPTLFTIASGKGSKYQCCAVRPTPMAMAWLRDRVLGNPGLRVVMHNSSFDLKICHRFVLPIREIRAQIVDTLVLAWIFDNRGAKGTPKPFNLKSLADQYLGMKMDNLKNIFKNGPDALARKDLEKAAIKLKKDWLKIAKRHERRRKFMMRQHRDNVLMAIRHDAAMSPADKATAKKRAEAAYNGYSYDFDRAEVATKRLIGIYRAKHAKLTAKLKNKFVAYAIDDAYGTLRLYWKFRKGINKKKMANWARKELSVRFASTDMEIAGIEVDKKVISGLDDIFTEAIQDARAECFKLAGEGFDQEKLEFNVDSPREVSLVLHAGLKLAPDPAKVSLKEAKDSVKARAKWAEAVKKDPSLAAKEPTRFFNTPKLVLEYTEHPLAQAVLDYRRIVKLKGTYTKKLSEVKGRVHAYFRSSGTDTGRFASSGPNLQNIPSRDKVGRRIREAFVAKPGWKLIVADLSQIELRIAAILCEEPTLLKVYSQYKEMDDGGRDYSVGDVHEATRLGLAALCPFDVNRFLAKIANFALLYGMSSKTFAIAYKLAFEVAEEVRNAFFQTYRFIEYKTRELGDMWKAHCRSYRIPFSGRQRHWDTWKKYKNKAGKFVRETVYVQPGNLLNTIVQGSAADVLKMVIDAFHRSIILGEATERYRGKVNFLLQVHDELVYEAEDSVAEEIAHLLKYAMEYAYWVSPIPFLADAFVVDNWGQGKDGHATILGPDGKPIKDQDGNTQTRLLYPDVNESLHYQTIAKREWAAQFFENPRPRPIRRKIPIWAADKVA